MTWSHRTCFLNIFKLLYERILCRHDMVTSSPSRIVAGWLERSFLETALPPPTNILLKQKVLSSSSSVYNAIWRYRGNLLHEPLRVSHFFLRATDKQLPSLSTNGFSDHVYQTLSLFDSSLLRSHFCFFVFFNGYHGNFPSSTSCT